MKLGFFGGCFNPPTNVHINIAKELINNKIIDKVIFTPIGDFYYKDQLIPIVKRCEMLELAINGEDNLLVEDFEKNLEEAIYAKDAFKIITEKYKNSYIYFIMGSDNFLKMHNWKNYNEIINLYKYIVVERRNFQIRNDKDNIIVFTPEGKYGFDSTTVRNLIKENKRIDKLVPPCVNKYIKENKLYIS